MPDRTEIIHEHVRDRFARIASDPGTEQRFRIGRASAVELGYDAAGLSSIPLDALEAFAGVGDPLSLAPVRNSMTVLDLGCGSGVDTIRAADRVGPAGRVIGIDMTPEMVDRARNACRQRGLTQVEIRCGTAETLDLPDEAVDVAISNGVINLCPDKPRVLAILHRVLKPGGRLQIADMSLRDGINPELLERIGEWSD
jgi:SAM-dependent methyltransferase